MLTVTNGQRVATFSDCREYRYTLSFPLHPKFPVFRTILFIMLNPSTADEFKNDPTIERCQRRAENYGCEHLIIANLFAYRSTSPNLLYTHREPVGEDNDERIIEALVQSDIVVAAWGTHGKLKDRQTKVLQMIQASLHTPYVLGLNADGTPKHPLYISYDVPIMPNPKLLCQNAAK